MDCVCKKDLSVKENRVLPIVSDQEEHQEEGLESFELQFGIGWRRQVIYRNLLNYQHFHTL